MSESVRHIVREIYCEVLFEMADEAGVVDEVMDDLYNVAEVFAKEPDFAVLMASQTVKGVDKGQAFRRVFTGRISDLSLDFLSVLARRGRMSFLTGISDKYSMFVDKHHHRSLIEVTLAKQPDTDQVKKLKEDLGRAIEGQVKLSVNVDPAIIGGMIIKKDDTVIDNSIKRALTRAVSVVVENIKLKSGSIKLNG